MPEGDILRRTAVTLSAALDGSVVVAAELRWPSVAAVDLSGRTLLSTQSYGKHLFMRFDDGRTVHSHLRMEGSWRLRPNTDTPTRTSLASLARNPFDRAVIATEHWTAIGHRLGMLDVVPTRDEGTLIAHLGPDLLADDFPGVGLPEALRRFAEQGSTPVAEVLLDQRVVAGIGTIYMAESLFARRLWPWTPADKLADPASLLMTARVLMERSVAAQHGTGSDNDPWVVRSVHGRRARPCR
ncbi:MAG TPA: DNA-formamidopyrimidine glycosylase family protein, partial [Propionicimonas sp.]